MPFKLIFFFVGCDSIKFLEGGGGIWWKVALLLPPPPLSPPFPLGRSYNRGVCARGRHDEGGCNRRFIRSRERGRQKLKLRRDFFIPPEENKAHLCLICCRCKLLFSSSSGGKTRWVGIDGSGGFIGERERKKCYTFLSRLWRGFKRAKSHSLPSPPLLFLLGVESAKGKQISLRHPLDYTFPENSTQRGFFISSQKTVIFLRDWTDFFCFGVFFLLCLLPFLLLASGASFSSPTKSRRKRNPKNFWSGGEILFPLLSFFFPGEKLVSEPKWRDEEREISSPPTLPTPSVAKSRNQKMPPNRVPLLNYQADKLKYVWHHKKFFAFHGRKTRAVLSQKWDK